MTDQTIYVNDAVYDGIQKISAIGINMLAPGMVAELAKELGYIELYNWIQEHLPEYVLGVLGNFEREVKQ